MIEIRKKAAQSGAYGYATDEAGNRFRARSDGAPKGWVVLQDGKLVDSFLTKKRAEEKADLLRAQEGQ